MKKTISLFLSFILLLSTIVIPVSAEEENNATVYVTLSQYGEILSGKDGTMIASVPVELFGKSNYELNDAFIKIHEDYYDGDDGYATEDGPYGQYISKFWGDTSANFVYQVNFGTEYVMGPAHEIEDGDYIELAILKNSEGYTWFDTHKTEKVVGDSLELTLNKKAYEQDDSGQWVETVLPCEGATIIVNGEEKNITTDSLGKATVSFDTAGEYIISAKKGTLVNDEFVTEITAPFSVVTIKEHPHIQIMHNIAKSYMQEDKVLNDGNMCWLIADLEGYRVLNPDTENVLTDDAKQKCLRKIIALADEEIKKENRSASVLAKSIIALRAMGYDAKKIHTENDELIDIPAVLSEMIADESTSVTNEYTLPYVLIALQQDPVYATEDEINYLVNQAITNKNSWLTPIWGGTDALSPMLLALAPYYDENDDVKIALDEAVEKIGDLQSDNGSLGYNGDPSAESTGLAIAGLSAVGIDAKTVIKNDKSLIDGLMLKATDTLSGFMFGNSENSMSTEQGFRGLVAWQLSKSQKRLYDFSGYPKNDAYAIVPTETPEPPSDTGSPNVSKISVKLSIMVHDEDECDNSYTYRNDKKKYTSLVSDTVRVDKGATVFDVLNEVLTSNNIEFFESNGYVSEINGLGEYDHGKNSGWMFMVDGKNADKGCKDIKLEKNSTVVWYYTDDYTKEDEKEYTSSTNDGKNVVIAHPVTPTPTLTPTQTPMEFSDVKDSDWYYEAVKYVHKNNLMQGTDSGFEPDKKMTRAMLVTVLYRMENQTEKAKSRGFTDVCDGQWYTDAVYWAAENGIVNGISDTEFAPNDSITREQMAAVLYRYAQYKKQDTSVGEDTNILSYTDAMDISEYAIPAIQWMAGAGIMQGETDSTINPKNNSTRAQVATILMRYLE